MRTTTKTILVAWLWMAVRAVGNAQNPFLPLWEYIPDGEPYVAEDPDKAGSMRVYIFGSHDSEVTQYCGREQVVWSAPVEDLCNWRCEGVAFENRQNRDGEWLRADRRQVRAHL